MDVTHVVLLGDSVFDNAAYVARDAPDVRRQVEGLLRRGSLASLSARDGAMIADVLAQLGTLPRDATHLVISAGGNDALRESEVLQQGATSVADALQKLGAVADRFAKHYADLVDAASKLALSTAVCTIYEPRFPEAEGRKIAATALTLLNDRITREAFARGVGLIDLRILCTREEDFANPIEPSVRGGEKIARAVAAFAQGMSPSALVFANR